MDPGALTKAERASAQCVPAVRAGQAVAKSAGAIYSDNMGQQDFIAVDWGTTNRRAYRIRAGAVIGSVQDALGVTAVPAGGFEQEVARLREALGDAPMLLAGMVGSNRGWVDAGYVPTPATLEQLSAAMVAPTGGVRIIPGVRHVAEGRGDVMRGEEVQLLGAISAGLAPPDALLCQPGTHCKWAWMRDGAIARFVTAMTGEMFALLRNHALIGQERPFGRRLLEYRDRNSRDPQYTRIQARVHHDLLRFGFGPGIVVIGIVRLAGSGFSISHWRAVNAHRRAKHQPGRESVFAHRLNNDAGAIDINAPGELDLLVGNRRQYGSEVNNSVDPRNRGRHVSRVRQVARHHLDVVRQPGEIR